MWPGAQGLSNHHHINCLENYCFHPREPFQVYPFVRIIIKKAWFEQLLPDWKASTRTRPPRAETPHDQTPPWDQIPQTRHTPQDQTPTPQDQTPPDQMPPWNRPPWNRPPLPRKADSSIRSTSGRYASYWNAFLSSRILHKFLEALIYFHVYTNQFTSTQNESIAFKKTQFKNTDHWETCRKWWSYFRKI